MPGLSLDRIDFGRSGPSRPKYERLKRYLVGELTAGRLQPGQALPSEMHLAGALKMARNTVRQALSELEQEGLILRVRGKGTFVHQNARRRLRRGLDAFALVVPETRTGYYPSLLHGFENAAGEVQHQAIVCSTENDVGRQANIVLQLMDQQVGGVALVPTTDPPTPACHVRQLQERGIPVVFGHRRVDGVRAPLLAIPFREVGRMAGRALVEHGHRRVAFFGTHLAESGRGYLEGLREALREGGGDVPEDLVYFGRSPVPDLAHQEAAVLESLRRMLDGPRPPTGIMTSFDTLAEMIYLLLGSLERRVPEDISLVGVGGTWRQGAILHRLVSVTVDEVEVGRRAVRFLHEMRQGQRPLEDATEIHVPLSVSNGATLGPAPRCRCKTSTRWSEAPVPAQDTNPGAAP